MGMVMAWRTSTARVVRVEIRWLGMADLAAGAEEDVGSAKFGIAAVREEVPKTTPLLGSLSDYSGDRRNGSRERERVGVGADKGRIRLPVPPTEKLDPTRRTSDPVSSSAYTEATGPYALVKGYNGHFT